ncbi:MarR family winged helix-turn-helix transcriptional regulator [Pseudonocardia adelaidensis]|uniref:HTH marR-type domain-containing protein n=1 Tax=Pseudonocardia adelaidensis TaxID=648754 RepID=A0ABP9NAD5_9PSEU
MSASAARPARPTTEGSVAGPSIRSEGSLAGPSTTSAGAALPLDTTVGHLLRRAQQVHTALWSDEFAGDLTGPQYALLSALTQGPVVDQGTAGRLASLDKSTAADVIARLERNDWLHRQRHPSDGRRYLLSLTAPARAALEYMTPKAATVQVRLLEPLAAQDRGWFTKALARVAYAGDPPAVSAEPGTARALQMPVTPGHLLRRSEQLHGAAWARRVGAALTPSQYGLLSGLAWNAPVDQSTAGDLASLDKSSTADIIARLLRRGLVARIPDDRDRRRKLVVLTDLARRVLDELTPAVERVQRDLVTPLTVAEGARLVDLLQVVAYRGRPDRGRA